MRFLLVLFALLSGLSLPGAANAVPRTEVAGPQHVGAALVPVAVHCVVQAARVEAARPSFHVAQQAPHPVLEPVALGFAATQRSDRARE